MTNSHQTPEYRRNRAIVRARVTKAYADGQPVWCIGCGREIQPGMPWQVGHIIDAARGGSNALDNLGAQHRRENLSRGGRLGAQITNTSSRKAKGLPTW